MSFTLEIYNLLIRYTKDSEGLDVTIDDLYKLPWWRCVWGYWKAKAYYKMDGYYERLEDVPDGLEDYTIMEDAYVAYRGETVQRITKEDCKSIYGK